MALTITVSTLSIISLWFLTWSVLLLLRYAADIKKILLEPVLKYPVVIFESDDWGTGPSHQQDALLQIKTLLTRFSDNEGHHPVMTLGIILAEPDKAKIIAENCQSYYRRTLADARYSKLLSTIQEGVEQGTLSVHLHGMEHFWPASLMKSLDHNVQVKQWLCDQAEYKTEELPSELQSRWVDSSCIPSLNHNDEDIHQAIDEELLLYKSIFGQLPSIIVPPTFVWTEAVEKAYNSRGIKTLMTPGRQCIGRDNNRQPQANGRYFVNGEENDELLFLVRDNYFEPSLGHKAETVLQSIFDKIQCGRPALLEMHRFNFINERAEQQASLQELEKLLQLITLELPKIKFISAEQLAKIMREHKQGLHSDFILTSGQQRLKILLARIKVFFQFNRFAKYSGVNLLLKLV